MWHKAGWMGHPMRLELTLAGLLVKLANHYTTRGALSCKDLSSLGLEACFRSSHATSTLSSRDRWSREKRNFVSHPFLWIWPQCREYLVLYLSGRVLVHEDYPNIRQFFILFFILPNTGCSLSILSSLTV